MKGIEKKLNNYPELRKILKEIDIGDSNSYRKLRIETAPKKGLKICLMAKCGIYIK